MITGNQQHSEGYIMTETLLAGKKLKKFSF